MFSFAVVGPGRVGRAFARLWSENGCELRGFVGRDQASVASAIEYCGGGQALEIDDLGAVGVVLLSTPDDRLAAVVQHLAAGGGVPSGCLAVHTSGVHGLDVFAPLADADVRLGSLHPLCPVPDPTSGVRDLPGKPAVVVGDPDLEELARCAGLRPVRLAADTDRSLYHAACALAANGLTALSDLATSLFEHCGADEQSRSLALVLMRAALDNVERDGAASALTGPVQRGDREVVARHLAALVEHAPHALATYGSLMERAAHLAGAAGHLDEQQVQAFVDQLRGDGAG